MPNGLRVGAAAMNALGVEHIGDSFLHAILELGDNHCATCFADGIQVITGCTYGKGNIVKSHKGKWGVTLIDKRTIRAVRLTLRAEAMLANKKTEFFTNLRMVGVPPTQVPDEVVEPLVKMVMGAPEDKIMIVSEVFDYNWPKEKHLFDGFVCEECGEMVAEQYGRIKGNKKICQECAAK